MEKYRTFAHDMRRKSRAIEFLPYDEIISKRIPGIIETDAEIARQAIREKYNKIQNDIDTANTPEKIKNIINKLEL
jgi:hypothetical protein